jgi:hypothetical protein
MHSIWPTISPNRTQIFGWGTYGTNHVALEQGVEHYVFHEHGMFIIQVYSLPKAANKPMQQTASGAANQGKFSGFGYAWAALMGVALGS